MPVPALTFGTTNAKLAGTGTATFSIPAGLTCPGARDCHAYCDRDAGRLVNGAHQQFRCFAASQEAAFVSYRESVDRNLALLKQADTTEAMAELITLSLPAAGWRNIRVHVSGDFYSPEYFLAWVEAARMNPRRLFYAYTKSIPYWVKFRKLIPENLVLTASLGGHFDKLVTKHKLRHAKVIFHPDDAGDLEIDHDDSHARNPDTGSFALLLHGTQGAGTEAASAIKRMRTEKVDFSYPANGKRPYGRRPSTKSQYHVSPL